MKSLFNFYLDDEIKEQAVNKLVRLNGQMEKGQFASLLRVLVDRFIETPDELCKDLLTSVKNEYVTNTKSNKRSRM